MHAPATSYPRPWRTRLTRWSASLKGAARFALLTTKPFRFFQGLGIHVTPIHFYSPIPDIRQLEPKVWQQPSSLVGIDMQPERQRELMEEVFGTYQPECDFPSHPTSTSHDYYIKNDYFGYISAVAMYSLIRHHKPRRIIEVGAGNSTYLMAKALRRNVTEGHTTELYAVEPYPNSTLEAGFPELSHLVRKPVQEVSFDFFQTLGEADILSIDTSHAVRTGGDVPYLYLEVLPRLAPGVLVHIHDIFLPDEYPRSWLERRMFWNEQYLLQAFLSFNQAFEVVWGQRYTEREFPTLYQRTFGQRTSDEENFLSYSFWVRRKN